MKRNITIFLFLILLLTSCKQQSGENLKISPDASYTYEGTLFQYEGQEYDIAARSQLVNSIIDCIPVGKYIVVKGHCGPKNGMYNIFNTETKSFEKDIAGSHLTWYDDDITTAVYAFWSGIYDYDGNLLADLALSENAYIYDLKFTKNNSEVVVKIISDDDYSREETIVINHIE